MPARAAKSAARPARLLVVDDDKTTRVVARSVLKKAGFDVPTSMNDKHQKLYDTLREATAFDRLYVKDQVAAHAEAIAMFTAEAKHGKNSDLRHERLQIRFP